MIKAVLFDMDGVLAFTEGFYNRRRIEFLKRQGVAVDEGFDGTGGSDAQIWERLVPGDAELRDRLHALYREYSAEHPTPWREVANPEAADVIRRLVQMGCKVAICSSSYRALIDEFVEALGLEDCLDLVISGEECRAYKPDPDIYLTACSRLGVVPSEALVVEDSPTGIEAGVSAGALTCALIPPHGVRLRQDEAHLRLKRLADVCHIVARHGRGKTAMMDFLNAV